MLTKLIKVSKIILIAIAVVVASVSITVFTSRYMGNTALSFSDLLPIEALRSKNSARPVKYDLFDGHTFCEEAIRDRVKGKIISLTSDDRTARVNTYTKTNILVFKASVVPDDKEFLSEQLSTREFSIKCATSIDTNKVVRLNILPISKP